MVEHAGDEFQHHAARVVAAFRKLEKSVVLVGIPADENGRFANLRQAQVARRARRSGGQDEPPPQSGIGNAALGYLLDGGSPAQNIPARPFLKPGIAEAQDRITPCLGAAARAALRGDAGAVEAALNRAGSAAQGSVQQKIVDGPFVPNKPETIRRKGSNRPLIDTGQLRKAITYVIRNKGKISG